MRGMDDLRYPNLGTPDPTDADSDDDDDDSQTSDDDSNSPHNYYNPHRRQQQQQQQQRHPHPTHNYNFRSSPRRLASPAAATPPLVVYRRNAGRAPSSPLRRRDVPTRGIKPPTPTRSRTRAPGGSSGGNSGGNGGNGGRPLRGASSLSSPSSSFSSSLGSASELARGSAQFLQDTLGIALWLVRRPLAWALAVAILYLLAAVAWTWLRNSMYAALAPLCALPGIGTIGLPLCEGRDSRWDASLGAKWKASSSSSAGRDFPKLIDLQTHFEGVLESSVGGSVMALDLKKSEIAIRDLNTLVKHSKLVCRDDLSRRLEDFVAAAKSTSRQLSRFSSRVGGVVDNLLAMDEYAIRALENVQAAQLAGAAPGGFLSAVLAPFRGAGGRGVAAAEREVLVTFVQASSVMDTSIQRLIGEAELALRELDDLEAKLHVISEIVQRESGELHERTQEVLAQVWTILGGNRAKLANFEGHKFLLSNISVYRKRALALISRSLVQLQTMQSDLEDLRDRVAEPGLLDSAGAGAELDADAAVERIPLEVHIQSIRRGVDRLNEGMSRAKGREQEYMKAMLAAHDAAVKNPGGRGLVGE